MAFFRQPTQGDGRIHFHRGRLKSLLPGWLPVRGHSQQVEVLECNPLSSNAAIVHVILPDCTLNFYNSSSVISQGKFSVFKELMGLN